MSQFMRSIRVRLTLLYSGVLFLVAALLVAGLYFGLSLSLRDEPVSQTVFGEQVPVNDGSELEERTLVDAQAFEQQVNERTLRNLRNFSLGALGALFVASLAVGWVIAGRVLAPIAHITDVAREIQARELSRRIELGGPDDELKRLADTFDAMLARLDLAFASQRRFVADASHELRTPLATIKANLELALTDAEATAESRARAVAVIKRAIDRMARLTDDLLALARLDAPANGREPVALAAAARGRTRGVRRRSGGRAVSSWRRPSSRGVTVVGRPRRAQAGGREPSRQRRPGRAARARRVRLAHGEQDGWAWLAVADEGPGIAPEQRAVDLRPLLADRRRPHAARAAAAASASRSCARSPRRTAARSRCTPSRARARPSSSGCPGTPTAATLPRRPDARRRADLALRVDQDHVRPRPADRPPRRAPVARLRA